MYNKILEVYIVLFLTNMTYEVTNMTYEVLWTFDGKVWKTIVITRGKKFMDVSK